MTSVQSIKWSEMDQKFWVNDVDGGILWFEAPLDAVAAATEVALKQAALDERAKIVEWLRVVWPPLNYGADWPITNAASRIEAREHLT
jgi:hypothetical protein